MDWKTVEDVVLKGFGGSGDNDIRRASFPGFAQELVQSRDLDRVVRREDGDVLTGGAKDFMDEVGDDTFSGSTSNTDELHVADRVTIVTGEEFGAGALELRLYGRFLFRFGFRGSLRIIHHGVIITQKTLLGRDFAGKWWN